MMDIYNALGPKVRLSVDESTSDKKKPRMAAYQFIKACVAELKFRSEECFIVGDLYGDDTTGFVKVSNQETAK